MKIVAGSDGLESAVKRTFLLALPLLRVDDMELRAEDLELQGVPAAASAQTLWPIGNGASRGDCESPQEVSHKESRGSASVFITGDVVTREAEEPRTCHGLGDAACGDATGLSGGRARGRPRIKTSVN
eukprot:TRINITY_DN27276_c0_g1_i1.p2 TRINITY_DN27276_c0_g1~~TRINITY_DN27276_c0_g1_i1.p2  ORF type:complete len:128 (+),score=10.87 TRINITY_DN27276_c0_g1_i1:847-1230(+)